MFAALVVGCGTASAQGMAVNATGSAADASAMLDVSSVTKGVLAPRMTATQRASISSPATGLLIYQTDGTTGFYFFDGAAWTLINALTNVTTQGNTFNGNSQLVQTNPSGQLPAVSGTNLTNLNAASITTGTVSASRLGSGTASSNTFLRGDNTWATLPLLISTSFNNTGNATTYFPLGGTVAGTNNTSITQAETQVPVGFTVTAMTVVFYNTTSNSTRDQPTVTLYVNEAPTTMSYQYTTSGGYKNVGQYKSGIVTPTPVTISAGDMVTIGYTDSQSGYTENVTVTLYGHY